MEITLILTAIIGYLFIVFEHPLRINKTAPALLTGVLMWTIYSLSGHHPETELFHHLGKISEILFLLLGAMTIVEIIDAHQGFRFITDKVTTTNPVKLLIIIGFVTFFLSALLDNLTTTIVMCSLLRKLVKDSETKKIFTGIVIIAANAGGAWSPIGDVTTTMLWIGKQITDIEVIKKVFLPSLVSLTVPLAIIAYRLRSKKITRPTYVEKEIPRGSLLVFVSGIAALVFVPVFKSITHLPPYLGMLGGLSLVWVISELLHVKKEEEEKKPYTAVHALTKIDAPSILFFLGILLVIGCLETTGILGQLATYADSTIGNRDAILFSIGIGSSIVDNIPLVAAVQSMYTEPTDSLLWHLLAYSAGTGGSLLIIGSAAGVAAMGIMKIDFLWYLKKFTLPTFLGYVAGFLVFLMFN